MKKHLSVLMLFARSSIYKLLGLLILMAAAEAALFLLVLGRSPDSPLEMIFSQGKTAIVCGVAFVLYTALLCLTGCEFGSKQGYTLRRLRVSEWGIYFWQAGYNLCCYLIFWFVQLAAALLLCRLYMSRGGGPQDVFLVFYRNSFMHSLLPLDETSRYIRNLLLAPALGLATAYFPLCQRYGRPAAGTVILTGLTLGLFADAMGGLGTDVIVILLSVLLAAASVWGVYNRRKCYET